MFVKIQPLDTPSSFHELNSTRTTPKIGISAKPVRKHSDQLKGREPNGRPDYDRSLGIQLRPGGRGGNVLEIPQTQNSPSHDVKNCIFKTQNGGLTGPDSRIFNGKEVMANVRRHDVVKKVQTRCSTKWARYGGSIPAILETLETVPNLDEALKSWENTLSNKERSIILKEQLKWERAVDIFEWFRKRKCYEVNIIHYNIMLRILGKARRWDEVERLLDEMRRSRIEPINSTFGTLIDVYSKGGFMDKAMEWLELMKKLDIEPDEVTMGTVVQMYKKAGDFRKAEEFFKSWSSTKRTKMKHVHGNHNSRKTKGVNGGNNVHLRLSSHTYNNLIDTYGKAGQVKEACDTFELMTSEGIVPTTVTFNTMIHMYGKNGQLDKIDSLIRKMADMKCPLDTRTYNILISLHVRHDDVQAAARYFKEMKEASLEPDIISYRTLLYGFSIRKMITSAEELVMEMDDRGLEIDEFTQSALTRMYIEAKMLEKSWLWFQRFHGAEKMSSDCYAANIDAYGEREHVLLAEKVFNCCQEMKRLSVLVFNVMIKAYGVSRRHDEACYLFDSMGKHGILPDKCSYSTVIQILTSGDQAQKARTYVGQMHGADLLDDCVLFCAVISSFVKLGQLEMAAELYEEMVGYGIQPDVVVYGVMINAYAEVGSAAEATYYLEAMRSAGLPMNPVICNSLIKLYTKVGYLKEAQETYRLLGTFEECPDIYSSNCMIHLYSERSMVKQAEEIFENLVRKGTANEFSYAMMLCMYKRNGRFTEAVRIAHQMRELRLLSDLLSYNNVLGLYACDGRFKEAAATFEEMLISGIQPDDSTFKSLGIIMLKCGVPRKAIDNIEELRKKDEHRGLQAWSSTFSSIIGFSDLDDDDDNDF